jgi:vancomycin resistance protein VanJ
MTIDNKPSSIHLYCRRFACLCLALSSLLLFSVFFLYTLRPDSCAALTFFPAWTWFLAGFLTAVPGLWPSKRFTILIILAWIIFCVIFVEEWKGFARKLTTSEKKIQTLHENGQTIRVISLNCAGANLKAAEEVIRYEPDIVLLQEAPSRIECKNLAKKLFGNNYAAMWNTDTAILAKGRLQTNSALDVENPFAAYARVLLAPDIQVQLVSLHLIPPTIDTNIWSPKCWTNHTKDRHLRRNQIAQLLFPLDYLPESVPIILGGDFNVPAGDTCIRILKPRLRDTFSENGFGWPHTAVNQIPLFRVDQIWISKQIKTCAVYARKTENSDHRMVVCDLYVWW